MNFLKQGVGRNVLGLVCGVMLGTAVPAFSYTVQSATPESDGVVYVMSDATRMKLQVCTDRIIRVVYTAKAEFPPAMNAIVVKGDWPQVSFTTSETGDAYVLQTALLSVSVAKSSGAVSYATVGGVPILQETTGKKLTAKTVGGATAYEGTIPFNSTSDEGIYGFGQFQNGQLNQRGLTLEMVQLNQQDCSPFFMSTRGFGVLWNNYSRMTVTPPLTWWCNWATNDAIDYYFIYGPEFDDLIAGYRIITGPAVMWPKWAYGFWQCRNYYPTQTILQDIVKDYRSRGYPIDNIVQDWNYYPQGQNGCQCFEAFRYPDPAGMIKTVHDSLNCHFTISVWPSFNSQSGANYDFMSSKGYLINSNDFLGTTYDAFSDSASKYYWQFINDSLVSKGVDAFWPDATEPEYHTQWVNATTSQGPATKVENLFPLLHSKNLYDGFRKALDGKKRVCNLTRSYFAGSQRLGAAYWTGDIANDFNTYVKQIPALLNISASGLPLSCTDIGGFNGEVTANIITRWFQWGAFNPVFRIHGTRSCNEIWCWGEETEKILLKYLKLRYRLFPYVYSLAWKVTNEHYTMMRPMAFDFRTDPTVRNLASEFMFGPAMLVCPVTESATATSRAVYLPAGTWYDFWTGEAHTGAAGQIITAPCPMETMPLYVRAGSVLPMGPEITYADTAADPIELRVYTGADGYFNLYEDEGDNYNYEEDTYAIIPLRWNEATQDLTIGDRSGSFPGMLTERTFNVVFVEPGKGTGEAVSTTVFKTIPYSGSGLVLNKTSGEIAGVRHGSRKVNVRPSFSVKLTGRKLVVRAGNNTGNTEVSLVTMSGRLAAHAMLKKDQPQVLGTGMVPGIYLVYFKNAASVVSVNKVVVR
jgi:alpha-D-xyloside xylohydrolase